MLGAQRANRTPATGGVAPAGNRALPGRSSAALTGAGGPPAILALQRTAGNHAALAALALSRAVATEAPEAPTPLLQRGSSGPDVAGIQAQLSATGVPCQADGVFGAQTQSAVEFFQSAHRLVVDGIVGRETTAMLDRESTLHGDADARAGAPCHTPEAPGPDDQTAPVDDASAVAGDPGGTSALALGFKVEAPDGGGGGGTGAPPVTQKAPAADLVVNTSGDDPAGMAPPGSTPVKVISSDDLVSELKKRGSVGRLVIIGHAAEGTGDVLFDAGTARELIPLSDLARKLRGVATVQQIDFVSCSVGSNPEGLDEIKTALGAVSASGYTCHMNDGFAGPLTADGAPITTEAQFQALSPAGKAAYTKGLREQAKKPELHGDCLVDAPPGQKLAQITDDELRALAMRRGGVLRTFFAKEDGTCAKDMKFGGAGKCRRVQAK